MTDQYFSDTPFADTYADDLGVQSDQSVSPQPPLGDPTAPVYASLETEVALRAAIALIERARPMPMSASSIINKIEVLELLNAALAGLPEEFREARWLLKEREDFLARVQAEGDLLITRARDTAQRMVQRTELVTTAQEHARKLVADAEQEAKTLRLETEDWCDQQLGRLEVALDRISRTVAQGRVRMQGTTQEHEPAIPTPLVTRQDFLDQERL